MKRDPHVIVVLDNEDDGFSTFKVASVFVSQHELVVPYLWIER